MSPHGTLECEFLVVGLGALGAWVTAHAARRGLDVVAVDARQPGHDEGASGGQTRIFRLAYKEGSAYLPLLRESAREWRELQRRVGPTTAVWDRIGSLMIGPPSHPDVARVLGVAADAGLDVERLTARELESRWPQHRPAPDDIAVFDPEGGLLRPSSAIRAVVDEARRGGARILTGSPVVSVSADSAHHVAALGDGRTIRAGTVVYALGPWTPDLLPALAAQLELRQIVLSWHRPDDPGRYAPAAFPVGIRRGAEGRDFSFFPAVDDLGMKLNFHVERTVIPRMSAHARTLQSRPHYDAEASAVFRGLRDDPVRLERYVDAYTADNRPLLGAVGDGTWVIGGGSGQAFKMAPALGRTLVDLIREGRAPDGLPVRTPSRAAAARDPL